MVLPVPRNFAIIAKQVVFCLRPLGSKMFPNTLVVCVKGWNQTVEFEISRALESTEFVIVEKSSFSASNLID